MKRWSKIMIFIGIISLFSYHITIAQESQGGSPNPIFSSFALHGNLTPEEFRDMIEKFMNSYPEFRAAMNKLDLTVDKIIEANKKFKDGSYTIAQILDLYGLTPERIIEVIGEAKEEVAYRKLQENRHFLNMTKKQLEEEMAKRREQWLSNFQSRLGITKEELIKAFESGQSLTELLKEKGISMDQFHNGLRNLWMTKW